jgi:DNA-binding response OmpR family regulator
VREHDELLTANAVSAPKILVVDDEPAIVEAVTYNLRQQGFVPIVAADADAALRAISERSPDLIILDVMLPSGSGFDICRLVRQGGNDVPILMLTARVSETDRVRGLDIGADDYLAKPFGMRELMARVKALLRRGALPASGDAALVESARISAPTLGLTIDPLSLSRKEFDVLRLLVGNPGRVFDRQTLLDRVWGEDAYVDDRTIDVHIRWLREKIEPTPGKPQFLLTVRGVGYKFQA